jgi:hypothetical protein
MATWGAGLFDNDRAQELKKAFLAAIADGLDVPAATKQALWAVTDALKDEEEAPLVYLAMAALQLKHGALEEWLKVIALSHVLQETGLDQGDGAIAERKQVYSDLLTRLQSERATKA